MAKVGVWTQIADAEARKEVKARRYKDTGPTVEEWLEQHEEDLIDCPLYSARLTKDKCLTLQAEMHAMRIKKSYRSSNIQLGFYRDEVKGCGDCEHTVPPEELKEPPPKRLSHWRTYWKKKRGGIANGDSD